MRYLRNFRKNKSGAAAVEFAIVAPVFILLVMTLVAYGIYLTVAHSIQQMAADAARTAVAGVTETEREQLVQNYVTTSSMNQAFISRDKLQVTVAQDPTNANQFTVSLEYDASSLPIWDLYSFAVPSKTIKRATTIRMGGI
ncbi:MAG: pilus assembly protein [Rhizobiaceae bacterium]|nr:pilus assembly protein [Rhizobiaceae bacterium]